MAMYSVHVYCIRVPIVIVRGEERSGVNEGGGSLMWSKVKSNMEVPVCGWWIWKTTRDFCFYLGNCCSTYTIMIG